MFHSCSYWALQILDVGMPGERFQPSCKLEGAYFGSWAYRMSEAGWKEFCSGVDGIIVFGITK